MKKPFITTRSVFFYLDTAVAALFLICYRVVKMIEESMKAMSEVEFEYLFLK